MIVNIPANAGDWDSDQVTVEVHSLGEPGQADSAVLTTVARTHGRSSNAWSADEIVAQVDTVRAYPRASGTVHFSMKAFLTDQGGVASRLLESAYADAALVPPSPWLSKRALPAPRVRVTKSAAIDGYSVTMTLPKPYVARWYLLQTRTVGGWASRLLIPCACAEKIVPDSAGQLPDKIVVTALDRAGVASPAVQLSVVR